MGKKLEDYIYGYKFEKNYDFNKKRYKKAAVEDSTGLVYYEYLNEKKEEFMKFYASGKKEKVTETSLEICKTVNKALKRGYNPFVNKREYSEIRKIGTQRVNCFYLFMVYLYRWNYFKIDMIEPNSKGLAWTYLLLVALFSVLIGARLIDDTWSLPPGSLVRPTLAVLLGYALWIYFMYWRFDKKGYLHSNTGYSYYAEKYKGVLGFLMFLGIAFIVVSFWGVFL